MLFHTDSLAGVGGLPCSPPCSPDGMLLNCQACFEGSFVLLQMPVSALALEMPWVVQRSVVRACQGAEGFSIPLSVPAQAMSSVTPVL
jgi:hypothetical protein